MPERSDYTRPSLVESAQRAKERGDLWAASHFEAQIEAERTYWRVCAEREREYGLRLS